jgi:hypothetical protein
MVDNRYKLVSPSLANGTFELYDLETDPKETRDVSAEEPEVSRRLRQALLDWNESVKASVAGRDYPEGKVFASEPGTRNWMNSEEYKPYLAQWRSRPEFRTTPKKGK